MSQIPFSTSLQKLQQITVDDFVIAEPSTNGQLVLRHLREQYGLRPAIAVVIAQAVGLGARP